MVYILNLDRVNLIGPFPLSCRIHSVGRASVSSCALSFLHVFIIDDRCAVEGCNLSVSFVTVPISSCALEH